MTEKILPRPVKSNKYGQSVACIDSVDYYTQIFEEINEAIAACIVERSAKICTDEGCGQCIEVIENQLSNESEIFELVDVITCCVTRMDILGCKADAHPVNVPVICSEKTFYNELTSYALNAFRQATLKKSLQETGELQNIIYYVVRYLYSKGIDKSQLELLYSRVNEKNERRGYFEEGHGYLDEV